MSSIDEQIQQFERVVQTHATARINSDLEIIKTTMDRRTVARIELIRAADALDAQLSAAQARIVELANELDRKNDVIEGWRSECAEHADARATAEKRVAELEAERATTSAHQRLSGAQHWPAMSRQREGSERCHREFNASALAAGKCRRTRST